MNTLLFWFNSVLKVVCQWFFPWTKCWYSVMRKISNALRQGASTIKCCGDFSGHSLSFSPRPSPFNVVLSQWVSFSTAWWLGSLSNSVFERRTSTWSGLSNTNMLASRYINGRRPLFRLTCIAQKRRCVSSVLTRCQGPVMASGDKVSLSFPDPYNTVYVENEEPHAI